jgi:uroporphyrin-III C-methyltransferase
MSIKQQGSLVVVGTGISVAGQMTLLAHSYIQNADIVFMGITDTVNENVVKKLNPNPVELDDLYQADKSRAITYQQMTGRIVDTVKAGQKVCDAFYGHPGVFVNPSHAAIKKVRDSGLRAEMLLGISAEDCLIADLGIEPAHYGCQSYEATLEVLDASQFKPGLDLYSEILMDVYPTEHEVILYEAATLPFMGPELSVSHCLNYPIVNPH